MIIKRNPILSLMMSFLDFLTLAFNIEFEKGKQYIITPIDDDDYKLKVTEKGMELTGYQDYIKNVYSLKQDGITLNGINFFDNEAMVFSFNTDDVHEIVATFSRMFSIYDKYEIIVIKDGECTDTLFKTIDFKKLSKDMRELALRRLEEMR